MAIIYTDQNWPSTLPCPSDNYSIGVNIPKTINELDSGRYRCTFNGTKPSYKVSVNWLFTDSQLHEFKVWHRNEIKNGSLPFNIDLAFGIGINATIAYFVDGNYSASMSGHLNWMVSAVLDVPSPDVVQNLCFLKQAERNITKEDLEILLLCTFDFDDTAGDLLFFSRLSLSSFRYTNKELLSYVFGLSSFTFTTTSGETIVFAEILDLSTFDLDIGP